MCCVQLPSRPTSFRSTFVKPYFWPENTHDIKPDKLEVTTKPDKPEATAKSDELEAPPLTPEVPQEPAEPAVKHS